MKKIWKRGAKPTQWDLFKEYKKCEKLHPKFVTPASTAKYFCQLSFNYKSKEMKMPTISDLAEKFEFQMLNNSGHLLQDIKKLILDGRGSNHAYAQDGLTLMSILKLC